MNTWKTKSGYLIYQLLSGRNNSFLLTNETNSVLIDTGQTNNLKKISAQIKNLHVDRIDVLILTHTHFDHVGNASIISRQYKAKIIVHQAEAALLMAGESRLSEGSIFITKFLVSLLGKKLQPLFAYLPVQPDILVNERMTLNEFGFNAFVMHTPGHSPGSISVIIDNEIAIVGDAMFGVFRNSVFLPFADDLKQMVISWGKLLETGCTSFLPGHGTENNRGLLERQFEKYKARYNMPVK
jgi:hydroxyacylglutathione hydrolase